MSQTMVMTRLSWMMFLQFFVWGAWYVTVGNYMVEHGMTSMIGRAYQVGPVAAIVSPFFLGMILGEATTGGLWLVIDALTGNYGNRITAM